MFAVNVTHPSPEVDVRKLDVDETYPQSVKMMLVPAANGTNVTNVNQELGELVDVENAMIAMSAACRAVGESGRMVIVLFASMPGFEESDDVVCIQLEVLAIATIHPYCDAPEG